MAITTAMCLSYKRELLEGDVHLHKSPGGSTFKAALYTAAATLDQSTTQYTPTNEVSGTGYTATGQAMVNVAPVVSGTTAFTQWQNVVWPSSSITARGCMFYNDSAGNDASVSVHDFGQDYQSVNGDFSILMPAFDAANALIRLV